MRGTDTVANHSGADENEGWQEWHETENLLEEFLELEREARAESGLYSSSTNWVSLAQEVEDEALDAEYELYEMAEQEREWEEERERKEEEEYRRVEWLKLAGAIITGHWRAHDTRPKESPAALDDWLADGGWPTKFDRWAEDGACWVDDRDWWEIVARLAAYEIDATDMNAMSAAIAKRQWYWRMGGGGQWLREQKPSRPWCLVSVIVTRFGSAPWVEATAESPVKALASALLTTIETVPPPNEPGTSLESLDTGEAITNAFGNDLI